MKVRSPARLLEVRGKRSSLVSCSWSLYHRLRPLRLDLGVGPADESQARLTGVDDEFHAPTPGWNLSDVRLLFVYLTVCQSLTLTS